MAANYKLGWIVSLLVALGAVICLIFFNSITMKNSAREPYGYRGKYLNSTITKDLNRYSSSKLYFDAVTQNNYTFSQYSQPVEGGSIQSGASSSVVAESYSV